MVSDRRMAEGSTPWRLPEARLKTSVRYGSVRDAQQGWQTATGHRLQTNQPANAQVVGQVRSARQAAVNIGRRGLYDHLRPGFGLPSHCDSRRKPAIPVLQYSRPVLPMPRTAIRSIMRTKSVHQSDESSVEALAGSRMALQHVPRRWDTGFQAVPLSSRGSGSDRHAVCPARPITQRAQISVDTNAGSRVSRHGIGLSHNEVLGHSREAAAHRTVRTSYYPPSSKASSHGTGTFAGELRWSGNLSSPRSTRGQIAYEAHIRRVSAKAVMVSTPSRIFSGTHRATLVDKRSQLVRSGHQLSQSNNDYELRRQRLSLVSLPARAQASSKRSVHSRGASTGDTQQRTLGSEVRTSVLRSTATVTACTAAGGQPGRSLVVNQPGKSLYGDARYSGRHLLAAQATQHAHVASMDSNRREWAGGSSLAHCRPIRSATKPDHLQKAMCAARHTRGGLVRQSIESPAASILQQSTRPSSNRTGRPRTIVRQQKAVRFSALGADRSSVAQAHRSTTLLRTAGTPVLAQRSLVAAAPGTRPGDHSLVSRRRHTSTKKTQSRPIATNEALFRIPVQTMKLPQSTRNALLELAVARYAPKTRTAYAARLAKFVEFCSQLRVPWCPASPETCAKYLLHLKEQDRVHGDSITPYFTVINNLHKMSGLPSPADLPLIRAAIGGFRHATARPSQLRRTYLSVEHVHKVTLAGLQALQEGRSDTATACALVVFSFVFFWRASTAQHQLLDDVTTLKDRIQVKLTFEKRWTHYNVRRELPFSKAVHPDGAFGGHPFDFLRKFIQLRRSQGGKLLFSTSPTLSHGDVSAMWRHALHAARVRSPQGLKYLPHSGRKGGPTAASAAGVDHLLLAARGGWKNVDSILSYVQPAVRHPVDFMYVGFLSPTVQPLRSVH
eukprot:TRINITY_DN150_c0_g3_i1.p1 TRINITY_DN150_c0_g3~~TRINITY_DN150_c0_g3_i1.p1  ORF type:complete len:896 (-),score=86.68 TRINITY_DN150_c0_g3_i1:468-3155(-)